MRTVVIPLDGVLQDHKAQPQHEMILMAAVLAENYRIVVIGNDSVEGINRWLKMNGISASDDIMGDDGVASSRPLRLRQIDSIRASGGISMVFEADATLAAQMVREGLKVLLYAHPRYIRPEHRPDAAGPTPWADLVHELDVQQGLADADDRLKDKDFEVQWDEG